MVRIQWRDVEKRAKSHLQNLWLQGKIFLPSREICRWEMNTSSFTGSSHWRVELELLYKEDVEECAWPDHGCGGQEIQSELEQQDFVGLFLQEWRFLSCYPRIHVWHLHLVSMSLFPTNTIIPLMNNNYVRYLNLLLRESYIRITLS